MNYALAAALSTGSLFFAMLLLLEVGRRIGARRLARDPEGAQAGTGAVDGALFALLGLLIAFTFSGAASRFDARRDLIVQEANAIGTAYLRLDLLPSAAQQDLRDGFRRYLDTRLAAYRKLPDVATARAELDKATALQGEIWRAAVGAVQAPGAPGAATAAPMLLLPALNEMIDITATRTAATQMHPPEVIYAMLFALALVTALLAGFGMAAGKVRNWIHMLGFAAALSAAIFVILDIEYPLMGLIRVDAFEQTLVEARASMD